MERSSSPASPETSLCLSGGGYRAAIFHLGALRWLNQCGLLPRLKIVSSVSGGSILAAHLAHRLQPWPTHRLEDAEWQKLVEDPFRQFVKQDLRTPAVLCRAWPRNWFRSWASVERLRQGYVRHLLGGRDRTLDELPSRPSFIFCSTDMVFGVNWESARDYVGNYEAGYVSPPPASWTLARAVAASSCFPPVFPPMKTGLAAAAYNQRGEYSGADRERLLESIRLTDGGLYDNLGLQPVMRERNVLVSDGGGRMQFTRVELPWNRLVRYADLLQSGIGKLRRSWLIMDYQRHERDPSRKFGTYWGIADSALTGPPDYGPELAALIASVRTDLNRFTDAEFEILLNHGYYRAARKMLEKTPDWVPQAASLEPPYDRWTQEAQVRQALRQSHKRHVLFRR